MKKGTIYLSQRFSLTLFSLLAITLISVSPALGQTRAYVANASPVPGTLSVIDTASNSVVATVPVHSLPHGVAIAAGFSGAMATERPVWEG